MSLREDPLDTIFTNRRNGTQRCSQLARRDRVHLTWAFWLGSRLVKARPGLHSCATAPESHRFPPRSSPPRRTVTCQAFTLHLSTCWLRPLSHGSSSHP